MEMVEKTRQTVWRWPAVLNFALGGMAAGYYLLIAAGEAILGLNAGPGESIAGPLLLAPALVCLGLLSLTREAGRPLRAVHLLNRLRSSWMSWESLAAGVFVISALLDSLTHLPLWRVLATLSVLGFLLCQCLIPYRAKAIPSWNRPLLPVVLLASAFSSGCGLLLVVTALGAWRPTRPLLTLALLCLTASMAAWAFYRDRLKDTGINCLEKGCWFSGLLLIPFMFLSPAWSTSIPARLACALTGLLMITAGIAHKARIINNYGQFRPLTLDLRQNATASLQRREPMNGYQPHPPSFGPIRKRWSKFWMQFAGMSPMGRAATWLASLTAPPHKGRIVLAKMNPRGYVEPTAILYHDNLNLGAHTFIGDRVVIFQRHEGKSIAIGDRVKIYRDTTLETGWGGSLKIAEDASIHPRCQINAYVAPIEIGVGVMIAPNCSLYSYNHGVKPDEPIRNQPMESNGPIIIGEEAWLGVGVIVMSGVRIGKGAVIGAGSLVTRDIPDNAIAVGVPAKVVKYRDQSNETQTMGAVK